MKKSIAIAGFLGIFLSASGVSFAGYFNSTPVVQCETQITQTLQFGSRNNEVIVLQQLLANAGFLNAAPNGYFGYGTRQAVKSFQYNNGITETGIVGPATRNAINERLCDVDLVGNTEYSSYSFNAYGSTGGTTYVGDTDPFVQVINPPVSTPVVYTNPGSPLTSSVLPSLGVAHNSAASFSFDGFTQTSPLTPSYMPNKIQESGLIFNPGTGAYGYAITPAGGSVTVVSPVAKSIYKEGDTISIKWATENLVITQASILLENTVSGQSKVVGIVSGNSYSFTLTKELLDSVCMNVCKNSQKETFRVVISTPVLDLVGGTSNLRVVVAPITITRPQGVGALSVTASRNPATSGELFKLFINTPSETTIDQTLLETYVVRVRAVCPLGLTVVVANVPCGQDFVAPFSRVFGERGIPTTITNTTWYKQDVAYEISIVDIFGQVVGITKTVVTANPAPFNW